MSTIKKVISEYLKNKDVITTLSRSDYHKLKMLCEAINESIHVIEYEVTVDLIVTRVIETFIQDHFEDSTTRIVKRILPDISKRGRRV